MITINFQNISLDANSFKNIKELSNTDWFEYGIFSQSVDNPKIFEIRLSNTFHEHSYKIIKCDGGFKIKNHPIWIKLGEYDRKIINITSFFLEGNDVLLRFSLNDELISYNHSFDVIKRFSFGCKIKNKLISQKLKDFKYGVKIEYERECSIKYGLLSELLHSKKMIFECKDNSLFSEGFRFIILDVINCQLLAKKWNGRVFCKAGNLCINPDVFLNCLRDGRIIIFR